MGIISSACMDYMLSLVDGMTIMAYIDIVICFSLKANRQEEILLPTWLIQRVFQRGF
jgi:hypothetical protein